MLRKDIYVYPSTEWLGRDVMDALTRLVPVQFKSCAHLAECRQGGAVLSLSDDDHVSGEMSKGRLRFFHVTHRTIGPRSENPGELVQFANSSCLDTLLRGRKIPHQELSNLRAVRVESGDEVLASYGELPVWVFRRSTNLSVHIVSAPLPQSLGEEKSFDYLNGYHFIQLLPLLHFLREVTTELGWMRPPLRACFMFDDPNLHWPSYGFLSYRELIQQAKKDRFHAAFATVPLDAWGSHSRTVSLFKENTEHLSLLIHGNDHTRDELGQVRTPEGHLRLVGQSLRRIERLERVTGLHVDRVMVPPHEALTYGVLTAMLSLGFEGVSLAPWSLRNWNPNREWPSTFGLDMAEMTDGDFPVLLRYSLSDACEGPIVISAFLGSPIILSEHHTAVANGLELLSDAARAVNSLGEVHWCGTEAMLRSNYLCRQENTTLRVRPFSCRVELRIPENIRSLALPSSGGTNDVGAGEFSWVLKRPSTKTATAHVQADGLFNVVPGETIELISRNLGTVDLCQLETPGFSAWALSRRVLCEVRDRLLVLKPRTRWA